MISIATYYVSNCLIAFVVSERRVENVTACGYHFGRPFAFSIMARR